MKLRFLLSLFFIFIAACAQTQTTDEARGATACPYSCSSGDVGVETTVNAPKESGTVHVAERLAPRVKVLDVGEASIDSGLVCITGLNEDEFRGVTRCDCEAFTINLDDPNALGYEDVIFSPAEVTEDAVGDHALTVYTRYSYSTFGIIDVCLSGDPDNEKECDTSETKNRVTVSSAGPVEITDVTQRLTPLGSSSVTLRLDIKTKIHADANQQLLSLDDVTNDACVLESSDAIPVDVSLVLFEEEQTGCKQLTFEQGEDTASVSCTVDIDTANLVGKKAWEGYVRLDYGFQEIQSVPFTVTND